MGHMGMGSIGPMERVPRTVFGPQDNDMTASPKCKAFLAGNNGAGQDLSRKNGAGH